MTFVHRYRTWLTWLTLRQPRSQAFSCMATIQACGSYPGSFVDQDVTYFIRKCCHQRQGHMEVMGVWGPGSLPKTLSRGHRSLYGDAMRGIPQQQQWQWQQCWWQQWQITELLCSQPWVPDTLGLVVTFRWMTRNLSSVASCQWHCGKCHQFQTLGRHSGSQGPQVCIIVPFYFILFYFCFTEKAWRNELFLLYEKPELLQLSKTLKWG